MAVHGLVQCQSQSRDSTKTVGGLSPNSITLETLARISELIHTPRTNQDEIQDLYRRACLNAEELVQRQAAIMDKLSNGEFVSPAAASAVKKIITLCQTAYSVMLCVALGCNAILSALSPWDASLAEDSTRYCDDVLSLAQDVAPYRPLGASHFPLCLIAAYMTVADPLKRRQLRYWLIDFQKDFAWWSWLDIATKARDSYQTARRLHLHGHERGMGGKAGEPFQEKDNSFCAVQ
jgi:hypothetical protein